MSNVRKQNKRMVACLLKTIKIIFLIAILFAVGLNTSHAQNTWARKADCGGLGRWAAVGFSIGSKGYIGTGKNGTSTFLSDFWEYDPSTNVWTQKADFGGGIRFAATGFSIGNKGYVGTGGTGGGISGTAGYNDFWEYDPATNAWTQKANFAGKARIFAAGFSIGNKGYISTGDAEDAYLRDLWAYDPTTDMWMRKANFPGAIRREAVAFSIGDKGYLGTGYYKDFWEYDPVTDIWTRKANFGGGFRIAASGFSIGSKGYIGTGWDGSYRKDFWEYDPATNAWTQKADFGGIPTRNAVGFSIGNRGYIGTGGFFVGVKSFWEYTPDNACISPTSLRVQDLSDTSAILKWDIVGPGILQVRMRYRAVGSTTWTIKNKQGDKPSVRIDGLIPNTTYQWQTRCFCAADTSGWVKGPDFTTTASLNPGAKVTAYPNPAKNTITVNYSAAGNCKYIVEITNANGNVVLRKEANAISGANHITLNISRFFKGVYFISIIKPDLTRERIQLNKE